MSSIFRNECLVLRSINGVKKELTRSEVLRCGLLAAEDRNNPSSTVYAVFFMSSESVALRGLHSSEGCSVLFSASIKISG